MVYAERGVQLSWSLGVADVSHLLGRRAYVWDLILISWNQTVSGSYIYAVLKLNLTADGFYGWESNSLVGLTVAIDAEYFKTDRGGVRIRVLADNGTYYGNLLARGWVEVYYLDQGKWVKAGVRDTTYEGFGYYRLTLESTLPSGTKVLVVASDERGILVLAQATVP